MKNLLVIITTILIAVIGCSSDDKNIEGIWIGAYQIHYSGEKAVYSSLRTLIEVDKDEITFKTFDYPQMGEIDSIHSMTYHRSGYVLTDKSNSKSDTLKIKLISEDSIVFSGFNSYERDWVYKRIKLSESPKNIEIKNKSYSLISENFSDSIDFINDSVSLHFGIYSSIHRESHWSINNYKNLSFLVIDRYESPPLLIKSIDNGVIHLELYHNKINDFELRLLNHKIDTNGLVGKWMYPETSEKNIPLPPPPPHLPDYVDMKTYINFTNDSVSITQYGRVKTKAWRLNSTHDFIYFPNELNSENSFWDIIELKEDKLTLRNFNQHFSYSEEREEIELLKQ